MKKVLFLIVAIIAFGIAVKANTSTSPTGKTGSSPLGVQELVQCTSDVIASTNSMNFHCITHPLTHATNFAIKEENEKTLKMQSTTIYYCRIDPMMISTESRTFLMGANAQHVIWPTNQSLVSTYYSADPPMGPTMVLKKPITVSGIKSAQVYHSVFT